MSFHVKRSATLALADLHCIKFELNSNRRILYQLDFILLLQVTILLKSFRIEDF